MTRIAVYVGCAEGRAIELFELDAGQGTLERRHTCTLDSEVQWLTSRAGPDMLYAPLRSASPSAAAFAVNESGVLDRRATLPLAASMAYLSVDGSGRHLLGASYAEHIVTVSGLGDDAEIDATGGLTARTSPGRHAHCVLPAPDNRFIYATSLGDDRVSWWKFEEATGMLGSGGAVAAEPGSGPRHLQFSRTGSRLYVLHEMSGTVTVYTREAESGELVEVQSISSIPDELKLVPGRVRDGSGPVPESNAIWCAELRLTPDNRYLYSTERSSSTVTRFAVDPAEGTLTYLGITATEAQPRGMNVDPTGEYLLVCGERSHHLTLYRIDRATGALAELSRHACETGPRCIEFAVLDRPATGPERIE